MSDAAKRGLLRPGDEAPDFELYGQNGTGVRLSDLLSEGPVVLYFYPKDFTPGCTAESCGFRDGYEEFRLAGAEVVGISTDTTEVHQAFSDRYNLPFSLLSDSEGAVRSLYGVERSMFGLLPGRVTFVIDTDRTVLMVHNSQTRFTSHVDEALKVLASRTPTAAN